MHIIHRFSVSVSNINYNNAIQGSGTQQLPTKATPLNKFQVLLLLTSQVLLNIHVRLRCIHYGFVTRNIIACEKIQFHLCCLRAEIVHMARGLRLCSVRIVVRKAIVSLDGLNSVTQYCQDVLKVLRYFNCCYCHVGKFPKVQTIERCCRIILNVI